MKKICKNRALSLFLALTMIFTSIPVSLIGASAAEAAPISILYNAQKVDNLVLMEDEKITLTTSASGSDSLSYRWQIRVDEESDKWVNIKGYTKDFCIVSYALIGSLLDTNGCAYLRCKATDGANDYLSNTLTVNVSYNAPITYEKTEEISETSAPAMARYSLRTANNNVSLAATDEELQSCTIVINYTYEDNSLAFEPFVATIEYGGAFNYTAVSPTVVGYAPYILQGDTYVDAKNVELDFASLTEDKVIDVIYRPVLVDYTVRHYIQNILDDNYELHTETNGQQYTGSQVGKCEIDIDGFSALYYEHLTVAADGSTVIEVYYDRNYYLVDFDLGGGYGVEPIYARYGATIGANDPTRAGYVFAGWELVGVDGVKPTETQKAQYDINDGKQIAIPQANLSYKALWTTQETTYTMVFWKENADDDNYSYWGYMTINSMSGSIVSGADRISEVDGVEDEAYFTYNATLTDKNVVVEGDGSTVVNVYYTRNTYTLTFEADGLCVLEEHSHDNCTLVCGLTEHKHSCDECCNASSHIHWVSSANTNKCPYGYEHTHGSACYDCGEIEHTHDNSCNNSSSESIVKVVTLKYDSNITDIWPIVDDNGVTYDGNSWQSSVTSKYYTFLEKMPNQDITLTDSGKSGNKYTWYYYLEVLPGQDTTGLTTREDDGKTYYLYFTSSAYGSSLRLTYEEDYFPITGFTQRDSSVPSFSNRTAYLYYTRNSHELTFSNYGDILEDKTATVLYGSSLADKNFTPDYPDTLEPNAYEFKGWYTTPQCFAGTEFNFTLQTMPDGDLLLYAKWAPVQHEVNIYLDATLSKQIGTTQLVNHKDLASAPDEAVENGNYTFAGWFYIDEDGTEKAFVFNSMPINQDMNIYAKWSSKVAVKYEVYYKLQGTDTQIADPTIGSTLAGMNKTFLAKGGTELYADYQSGYFPKTNSHTVTMSIDGNNVFTFWYVEKDSVPYTVRYVDETTGEELHTTKSITDNKKAVVTEVFEPISAYMPDAYQNCFLLSVDNAEQNVITFYYTKDEQHAYYRIAHYVQNLSGNGYTEYRSIESVGTINGTYSADALTISGFEFVGSKSEVNNVVSPVTGTTVSGKLTADGLLIELFYDRIEVNYTVKYLESGTNKVLATEKTESGIYGQQVSETYLNIDGYELIGTPTRTLTLAAASERNVIIFYYQEKNITIQYVPVGSGKVSIGSENVLVISGPVNGSVPTPDDGFKFIGWYLDEDCKIPVNLSWIDSSTGKILPQKNADELYEEDIYYAKFEPDITSLTIKKVYPDGADYSIDENQTFIFTIKGVHGTNTEEIDLTVTIHGSGEITITDLPIGEYVVTEHTDWSWRYKPTEKDQSITLSAETNSVEFENTRAEIYWLDGDSYKVNIFKEKDK